MSSFKAEEAKAAQKCWQAVAWRKRVLPAKLVRSVLAACESLPPQSIFSMSKRKPADDAVSFLERAQSCSSQANGSLRSDKRLRTEEVRSTSKEYCPNFLGTELVQELQCT